MSDSRRTHTRARGALGALLLTLGVVLAGPSLAGDTPDELFAAAGKAHQAGSKALRAMQADPGKAFIENEKAIAHFEQAQRLLEKYLELRPDDPSAESLMQDVLSQLFWCHKFSPMVDPEEIEPDDPEPEAAAPPPPEPGVSAEEQARLADEAKRKAAEEGAREAGKLLEDARRYASEHPDDGMGALAKFFYVAERWPESEAGVAAKAEADALQDKLFKVKPVVVEKPKKQPLTNGDKSEIEKALRGWLLNRQKIRCASCKGMGYSECKTCDGTGKIAGRAGRTSTCSKCKRGKIECKRKTCIEGIDTRMLEKVVIDARAPYYQEKIHALLGEQKDSVDKFLEALAATLAGSARAPAEISRAATELGIEPVQLRDVIESCGPDARIATEFKSYSLGDIGRKVKYVIRGDDEHEESVTFEQQDGKWYIRDFKK